MLKNAAAVPMTEEGVPHFSGLAEKKACDPDSICHELPSGGRDAPLYDQEG